MVNLQDEGDVYTWRFPLTAVPWHPGNDIIALWTRTLLSNERGRQAGAENGRRAAGASQGLLTGSATDDWAKSWGYESHQNPLPSSTARTPVRLTTIGSEPPPTQLSDEPNIGWVLGRGTEETKGEKGPDSAESYSPIHGFQERGRGRVVGLYTGLSSKIHGCGFKYNIKCDEV